MCNVVIIGASGHGKVIADMVMKSKDNVIGFLDDNDALFNKNIISNIKVIGKIEDCEKIQKENSNYKFIIAIGNNYVRKSIAERYSLNYYTAIHPTAIIGMDVIIKDGSVIMANVVINSSSQIGQHTIINTASIVEHDNVIENYVHISPNVSLAGTVKIGECTHIGIGSTVINNINICKNCIIGAGGVVIKDIEKIGTYVGVPVKRID